MDEELEQDESGDQQEPKISLVVGLLATFVFIILDLLSLIPGIGDIEAILGILGMIISYVSNAGGTILTVLAVANFIKLIPLLQEVPAWTPGWLFVWYAENHPKSLVKKAVTVAAISELGASAANLEKQAANIVENPNGSVVVRDNIGGSQQYTGSAAAEKVQEKRGLERLSDKRSDALDTLQRFDSEDENEERPQEYTPGQQENDQQNGAVDLTPKEEKNPVEVAGEELYNPTEDFGSWNNSGSGKKKDEGGSDDGKDEDDESSLAA